MQISLPDMVRFLGGEVLISVVQEMAFETSQKYKEGKFIIEKARLLKV